MFFQIKSYFNNYIRSTNAHGIHSPFVYELVTKCFYDVSDRSWYKELKNYRQSLLNSPRSITIEDFGAGSKKLKNKERSISNIAKNAGISLKRAKLLGRLVNYLEINTILEIGTSLGIATASLSLSKSNLHITTLEGCKNTATVASEHFKKFNLNNINQLLGNFDETLPNALKNKTFDFIYFDGNHQKEPTIHYFEQCLAHIHNDSMFIFDDIYWSKEMFEAWQYIKNHERVTISIDTFYWGIVFFRKEQLKQHFTIRL